MRLLLQGKNGTSWMSAMPLSTKHDWVMRGYMSFNILTPSTILYFQTKEVGAVFGLSTVQYKC
jgi:hypothetical protein